MSFEAFLFGIVLFLTGILSWLLWRTPTPHLTFQIVYFLYSGIVLWLLGYIGKINQISARDMGIIMVAFSIILGLLYGAYLQRQERFSERVQREARAIAQPGPVIRLHPKVE